MAAERGVKRSGNGLLALLAEHTIADVPRPDVILVPGGSGELQMRDDEHVLEWLRAAHETTRYTTSVCTGSLALAAAGLLDGARATTHWMAMDELARLGAVAVNEREVQSGKIITAAGVSAGIDMALILAAQLTDDDTAQAIQLSIEYDPQPPFHAGSQFTAPSHVVEHQPATSRFAAT